MVVALSNKGLSQNQVDRESLDSSTFSSQRLLEKKLLTPRRPRVDWVLLEPCSDGRGAWELMVPLLQVAIKYY